MTESSKGTLYVVATPIGNLEDLSPRAAGILARVAVIAAEDTRHTARLLKHLGVERPLLSLHEHNEAGRVSQLSARLDSGDDIALVSDAGTPLISDPGFVLVRALRASHYRIVPVPGPCALVAALSAAGLPTDRFTFNGFLPAKQGARRSHLETLSERGETLVFYETPHRIRDCLEDIAAVLGERRVVVARELTKTFETFLDGTAEGLLEIMASDPDQARGEFVVMVAGAPPREADTASLDGQAILSALLAEGVGVKQAAAIATRLLGGRKRAWYEQALSLKTDG